MKSYQECCSEVAKKHNIGENLVIGHGPEYWTEAADLYTQALHKELARVKTAVSEISIDLAKERAIRSKMQKLLINRINKTLTNGENRHKEEGQYPVQEEVHSHSDT